MGKLVENNNSIDLSKYRVLCVDDTEINRTVFKGLLKNTGAKGYLLKPIIFDELISMFNLISEK